jgi:hypothetical protein
MGGIALGMTQGQAAAQTAPDAVEIPFSHEVHVQEVGVQCLFCHNDAIRSPQASLPSLQTCMTCHDYVTVDGAEAQDRVSKVVTAYNLNARVQWPDVYKQPDFVYFSHRPHVTSGVACQTCHGEVQNMGLVEAQVDMNMGFCLSCHTEQVKNNPDMSAAEKARLTDCATCHK